MAPLADGPNRRPRRDRPLRAAGREPQAAEREPSLPPPSRGLNPSLLSGASEDQILRSYLDLVRTWRGAGHGVPLRLRQADVAVLVSILGTDSAQIQRRLISASACSPAAARRGRRLLLASLGVLAVGFPGAAVADASTFTTHAPSAAAQHVVALSVLPTAPVRAPSTSVAGVRLLAPSVATPFLIPPVVAAAPSAIAPEPRPAVPAGTEAVVDVPSLGMELPVIEGGQSVIDEGVAAHYEADGWEAPVPAGSPGTYWLAAHHTSHGAPFEALPDIAVGAQVRVTTPTQTFVYTITSKEIVGLLPGDAAIYGTDPSASVILLQTCIDDTRRLLVHGTLTATR